MSETTRVPPAVYPPVAMGAGGLRSLFATLHAQVASGWQTCSVELTFDPMRESVWAIKLRATDIPGDELKPVPPVERAELEVLRSLARNWTYLAPSLPSREAERLRECARQLSAEITRLDELA